MFILRDLAYRHPNKDILFEQVSMSASPHDKIALIGNNGVGKSTLLKMIAGELSPSNGNLIIHEKPYYVPQIYGQYNHLTVAQALGIEKKLNALQQILAGDLNERNLLIFNDDWELESRCQQAFNQWGLAISELNQGVSTLSGGQKTRLMLAGIQIHQQGLVLLDEPSNHLDIDARNLLYQYIKNTRDTLVIVSHDRKILNMLSQTCELTSKGLMVYGGNYEFYQEQKELEENSLVLDLQASEKALRKAKEKERETVERQQKLDARGKNKQVKAGLPTISMNTLKNNAERSTAKLKNVHSQKIEDLYEKKQVLREKLPAINQIRFGFDDSTLHKNKILVDTRDINFCFNSKMLWEKNIGFEIGSRDRVLLKGGNGSGKTTLIRIITGQLKPSLGSIRRTYSRVHYIDQDYSQIDDQLSVYNQAEVFNTTNLPGHEVKNILNKFLFTKEDWNKNCISLSGGEKMRLLLCCITLRKEAPEMIILDEPTNNLDIQNVEILTQVINEYRGALLVVSHDLSFTASLALTREISLFRYS